MFVPDNGFLHCCYKYTLHTYPPTHYKNNNVEIKMAGWPIFMMHVRKNEKQLLGKYEHKNWTAHTTGTLQIYMYVLYMYILPGTLYPLSCGLTTGNLIRKYNQCSCWQMKTVTESFKMLLFTG